MKAIIVLIGLGALVLGGVYLFGGYGSFDPDAEGRKAKAAIKPGMTLTQVLATTTATPKYQSISLVPNKGGRGAGTTPRPGPEVDFDEQKVQRYIKNNEIPGGFNLIYRFTEQVAFQVHFDNTGKVEDVEDVTTMADLLQSRE